mgnify:CR=1 FL=1|tara:strand:+ start:870 stop:1127 length:258 start_codon:yes stop_codon:yes gene_type:complete
MSKRLYFINDKPEEVRTLVRLLTWDRIVRECLKRGLREPTNANNFCIIVSKGRLELCYKYFKRPTIIMNLSPNELPHKGWRVYVG